MRFAHFEFDPDVDRLGEGPLSEVYKAVDLQLGRTVALKILRAHAEIDPQADTRFLREAKHTSSLDHPNIATIYEYGRDQGTSFIAMEFLQGRTLDKIIPDRSLGYEECLRIAVQVTSALSTVHKSNLIHRDLKPGNILLQDDGSLKLLDFGIARARDEAGITQHGMLVGTVLYMSPEQVRGDDLDFRSDIFSLGAVLYHVMTRALPFPGESFPEVCMAILDGQPARRPSEVRSGFPKHLEDFLARCLQVDPSQRFADAAEAHAALAGIADKMSGTTTTVAAALRGMLLIPPIECGEHADKCGVLATGVRKDLAGELARNRGLRVTLTPDGELPQGSDVDYVLRGKLAVEGPRARLELELESYESNNGPPRLEKQFNDVCEDEDEDEWTLQADLVRSALRVVRRRLAEASLKPAETIERKVDEARELALRAREVMHRSTTKHLLSAISVVRRALDLDRYCPLAYAVQAEAMVRKYLSWDGDPTFLEEARESAGRALALDAKCAEAHTALGFAYHVSGHAQDAQREYHTAIKHDKGEWLAHRLLGAILSREGNFKHASPMLRGAIGLKPEHIGSYDHLFTVLQRLDRYEEALEAADQGIAAAHKHLRRVADDQQARLHLAMLFARLGQKEQALAHVTEARRRSPKDGYTAFHSACTYALIGETESAIEALDHAQARGYYIKSELVRNTDLDVLRGSPAFEELAS